MLTRATTFQDAPFHLTLFPLFNVLQMSLFVVLFHSAHYLFIYLYFQYEQLVAGSPASKQQASVLLFNGKQRECKWNLCACQQLGNGQIISGRHDHLHMAADGPRLAKWLLLLLSYSLKCLLSHTACVFTCHCA